MRQGSASGAQQGSGTFREEAVAQVRRRHCRKGGKPEKPLARYCTGKTMREHIFSHISPTVRCAVLAAVVMLLAGCGLSPAYMRPDAALPEHYNAAAAENGVAGADREWWRAFNSPTLLRLQHMALENNRAFRADYWVLAQALAQARAARSSLLPSIDAGLSSTRRGSAVPGGYQVSDTVSGTVQASYEIDIWGKNYETASAQAHRAMAGLHAWRGAGLTLESETALTYFAYLAARENLAVYDDMIVNARDVLAYQEKREAQGAATPLDVARQRASVESMEAGRIAYLIKMTETRNSLCRLIGAAELPASIASAMDAEKFLDFMPPAVAEGMPSELLVRRPDVAEAEERLKAANANIGVARAAFLPGFSLTGSAGWQSDALHTLIMPASALYSLAGSALLPLFNNGKLMAQYDEAVAAHKEMMERYREAALAGYLEVATSLDSAVFLKQQEIHREQGAAQSAEAYRIARLRYEAGAEDFLSVLNAQETMLSADTQVVQTRLERLNAAVALFKALGGGWDKEAAVMGK